jgi:hypothetical protein
MARIEKDHVRTRNVAPEGLGTRRDKKQIIAAPNCEKLRLPLAEECLIKRISFDVALVIKLQVDLQFGIAASRV